MVHISSFNVLASTLSFSLCLSGVDISYGLVLQRRIAPFVNQGRTGSQGLANSLLIYDAKNRFIQY